jgi:hypothetical protein
MTEEGLLYRFRHSLAHFINPMAPTRSPSGDPFLRSTAASASRISASTGRGGGGRDAGHVLEFAEMEAELGEALEDAPPAGPPVRESSRNESLAELRLLSSGTSRKAKAVSLRRTSTI